MQANEVPKTVLKEGVIYEGDNGRLLCAKCAGQSARFTGFDLSGVEVVPQTDEDAADWLAFFGRPMACEEGCTSYAPCES